MEKNVAGKWVVFAFEDEGGTNPGEPVTGDAANITANVRIDGGAANAVDDLNPTELEDGYYVFDLTAAETNGDLILICPQSATANVNVIGVPGSVWTTPANFNDLSVTASTGKTTVGTNDDKAGYSISGTKTTLDSLNDVAATDIVSSGAITTSGGAVSNVTTVATTTNMRGTDNAALASVCTEARLAELDAANIPADVDNILTDTGTTGVLISSGTGSGQLNITSGIVDANIEQIETDATASTNLKNQFDGSTGLTGDLFPATQAQVGNIATGAGGLSVAADSFTLTTGTESAGTVTSTEAKDGTVHTITPSASVIDCYYEFDLGVNGAATEILWDGYVGNNGDQVEVFGYDWVAAGYVQVGTISGKNADTVEEKIFIFTTAMTGTGANAGKVRCQFKSDGADVAVDFNTDRILCEYTSVASEALILNSGVAQAGAANSITLATSASTTADFYNHTRVVLVGGTGTGQERIITDYSAGRVATITPAWTTTPDTTTEYEVVPGTTHAATQGGGYAGGAVWIGPSGSTGTQLYVDGTVDNPIDDAQMANARTVADALNLRIFRVEPTSSVTLDQTYNGYVFQGIEYNLNLGTQDASNSYIDGANVQASTVTGSGIIFDNCIFDNAVTIPPCVIRNSYLGDTTLTAGSAGNFYFNRCVSRAAGTASPNFDFGALLNASNLNMRAYSGGIEIENMGAGTGTYNASIEGFGALTLNANCSATSNISLRGAFKVTDNAGGAVTVTRDDTYTNTSDILTDTADMQPKLGTVTNLGGGATLADNLSDMAGATFSTTTDSQEAIRDRGDAAWTTGSGTGLTALASGTAQSGTASTIQLAAGETFGDDILNGTVVNITGGTGAGQTRVIYDYTGATDTATVTPNWTTNPDNTSTYEVVAGSVNVTAVSNAAEDIATATALATVDTNVDAILVDTGTTIPAQITALNDISVNDVLTTAMTESYGTDGSAVTLAQGVYVIMQGINEFAISGTTKTVKQLDGSTTAYTSTLDDAASPTSITRAT